MFRFLILQLYRQKNRFLVPQFYRQKKTKFLSIYNLLGSVYN